jgi:hypothetical protein
MSLFSRIFGKKQAPPAAAPRPRRTFETAVNEAKAAARQANGTTNGHAGNGAAKPVHVLGQPRHAKRSDFQGAPWAEAARKKETRGRKLSKHLTHTDAKFDEEETANFLLGMEVECRSTWIAAARWTEEASAMVLTVKKTGKGYTFPGIDYDAAKDFAEAYSKGSWYWIEWVGKYGTNGPVALEPEDVPGLARRVL